MLLLVEARLLIRGLRTREVHSGAPATDVWQLLELELRPARFAFDNFRDSSLEILKKFGLSELS